MACCVFAAWIFGIVWRGARGLARSMARPFGRALPDAGSEFDPEAVRPAPAAVRRVVLPPELRNSTPVS